MSNPRFAVLVGMILVATAMRLVPHPPNFTPITAMALFGGACFADKRMAFLVPLLGLFLSDLVLGFNALTPVIYGSFALIVCLGFGLRRQRNGGRIVGASIVAAVMFFILTNFGVWAFSSMYPKTGGGLADCFVMAIPFFGNTLISSVFYSVVLFIGLAFAERRLAGVREDCPVSGSA